MQYLLSTQKFLEIYLQKHQPNKRNELNEIVQLLQYYTSHIFKDSININKKDLLNIVEDSNEVYLCKIVTNDLKYTFEKLVRNVQNKPDYLGVFFHINFPSNISSDTLFQIMDKIYSDLYYDSVSLTFGTKEGIKKNKKIKIIMLLTR
jgi:hypothetical protein